MMLSRLLFDIFKNENKRNVGMYALSILIFTFVCFIPFLLSTLDLFDSSYVTIEELKNRQLDVLIDYFGFTYLTFFLTFCFAIGLGVFSFAFLHIKMEVDFYHSFPIKRNEIFFIKYISGFNIYFFTFILFQILALIFSVYKGLSFTKVLSVVFISIIFHTLFFLICYSLTIFAMLLTGKIVIGFIGAIIFIFFGMFAGGLLMSYYEMFFKTYEELSFNNNYLYNKLLKLSPFFDYFNLLLDNKGALRGEALTILSENLILIIFSILVVIIFIVIDVFVYNKRKLETCTNSMSNDIAKHFVRDVLVVIIALCGIYIAVIRYGSSNGFYGASLITAIISIVLFGVIAHCIIEIIYNQDFKMLFSNISHMFISIALALILFFIFKYDLFHFDSFLPNSLEVNRVMFKIDGESSYNYFKYNTLTHKYDEIHNQNKDIFENSNIMNIDTINAINTLSKIGIDNAFDRKIVDKNRGLIKNDEYIDDFYSDKNQIRVVWTLNNGKVINRKYHVNLKSNIEIFNKIYTDIDYKKSFIPLLRDEEKYEKITINNFMGPTIITDSKKLTEALKLDIKNANIYGKLNKQPITVLNCYVDNEFYDKDQEEYYSMKNRYRVSFPIYDSYENVLNFLRNIPLTPREIFGEDAKIILHYYGKDNIEVNDIEKKDEILDSTTFAEYGSFNNVFGFISYGKDQPSYIEIMKLYGGAHDNNKTQLMLIKRLIKNALVE